MVIFFSVMFFLSILVGCNECIVYFFILFGWIFEWTDGFIVYGYIDELDGFMYRVIMNR